MDVPCVIMDTKEDNVKRFTVYPAPHVELRIFASDEMLEDYKACHKTSSECANINRCQKCSWGEVTVGGVKLCSVEKVQQVLQR